MDYVKCADFLLTGLVVAWPAMLWSGIFEAAVPVAALLLFGTLCCGAMAEPIERPPL